MSGKREIIKEKSKGFLRIKHLLWPQSPQQLSAQDGVGYPERQREKREREEDTQSHSVSKHSWNAKGQSFIRANPYLQQGPLGRAGIPHGQRSVPAMQCHHTAAQCPGKAEALSTHSVLKHSLTELLDLLKKQEHFHELTTKVVSSRAHGGSG